MMISEESAIAQSAHAYAQVMNGYAKKGQISHDQALINRVNLITGRLIYEALIMRPDTRKWQWSMQVINDPKTVNAWSMAGGRMALYSGLIEKIKPTDDELAQVLAHEISHALAKHTAEKMSVAIATSLGALAVAMATDNRGAAMGASAAALVAITLPNSRTAETEADQIGLELAARAGYDPRAAVTLWQKMSKESGASSFDFLSTHPSSGKRIEALDALVPRMMPYYEEQKPHPVYPL
ncbi:MAG TPA: M48 family peptidase [Gammaproteobacteria bacterium]|nr:M48 family peptidase [Gammaproteobacteria bacterium]HDZ77852.1 M48 family peptidase [Gammaproteobacteria bacterium]